MSPIKLLFGAFALVAVELALLGASSASADALCEEGLQVVEEVEACLAPYPEETTVEGSALKASFVAGELFKVACNVNFAWNAEKDLEPGEGLEGQVTLLVFWSCTGSCLSVEAIGLPYEGFASASEEGDGTVTWTGTGKEGPGIAISDCFGSISCSYESEELVFAIDGGEPAHVAGKGMTLEKTGEDIFCPSTGSLSVDYELQQPNAGVLTIAQDVASISLSPFFPYIGLNQRADITILNTGTVIWSVNALELTNADDFDLVDPLPGEEECKGQPLARNESCKAGVKCKTLNRTTNLSVRNGLGTFFDPVRCQ